MAVNPPPVPAWPDQPPAPGQVGRPAGFWIRFVAYVIDGIILSIGAGVVAAIIVVLEIVLGVNFDDEKNVPAIIIGVVVGIGFLITGGWLYEALMTSSARGATIGKLAVGVRVVRADGTRLTFGRATGRHFLKTLVTPVVPLFIGYLLAAFTTGKRALHDLMGDTLVIKSP